MSETGPPKSGERHLYMVEDNDDGQDTRDQTEGFAAGETRGR